MTKKLFRGALIASSIATATLLFSSCGDSKTEESKKEDTKEVAEDKNDVKFDSSNKAKWDADFLVEAAGINQEEIELGKLAQKNGMMKEVKDMGKMLESDHTKALADEKALAAKKNISLPTSTTDDVKDAYKKLSEKKGKDFDKAYADMMVDGHKKAIDKFEKASTDATDPDIKAWAASMLPGLRAHLDHATTCQKNCEKM